MTPKLDGPPAGRGRHVTPRLRQLVLYYAFGRQRSKASRKQCFHFFSSSTQISFQQTFPIETPPPRPTAPLKKNNNFVFTGHHNSALHHQQCARTRTVLGHVTGKGRLTGKKQPRSIVLAPFIFPPSGVTGTLSLVEPLRSSQARGVLSPPPTSPPPSFLYFFPLPPKDSRGSSVVVGGPGWRRRRRRAPRRCLFPRRLCV